MKAIYTYWTQDGSNMLCRFPSIATFNKMAKITVEQSLNIFDEVQIYTDVEGKAHLLSIGLDESLITLVDYSQYDFDPRFWNYPKLISYSLQNSPFIHLDFDAILYKIPDPADIITEKRRSSDLQKRWNSFDLVTEVPDELICSGIVGGHNTDVFKDLLDKCEESVSVAYNAHRQVSNPMDLIEIEEVVLTDLSIKRGLLVQDCGYENYIHLQGQGKFYV